MDKILKCEFCDSKNLFFHSNKTLSIHHQNFHSDLLQFKCSKCELKFYTKKKLENHFYLRHKYYDDTKRFYCSINSEFKCTRLFIDIHSCKRHMSIIHKIEGIEDQNKFIKVMKTSKKFPKDVKFLGQIKNEYIVKDLSEVKVQKEEPTIGKIIKITSIPAAKPASDIDIDIDIKPKIPKFCNICGLIFRSRYDEVNHIKFGPYQKLSLIKKKPEQKKYECEKCPGVKFIRLSELRKHLLYSLSHNLKNKSKFKCSKCPKVFTWKKSLFQHERNFHQFQDRRFNCPVANCPKSYSRSDTLYSHQKNENHYN